jgi:hypothetical protein
MGLANGYGQVVISCAFIFSSSGLLTIAKSIENQSLIYYWLGGFIITIAMFLSYGIKDVIDSDSKEIQSIDPLDKNFTLGSRIASSNSDSLFQKEIEQE